MQIKKVNGVYVCYYKDSNNKTRQVNTKQTNLKDARDVVEAAGIPRLEKAAIAQTLSEQVVDTLMARPSATGVEALALWQQHLDERGKSPTTQHAYKTTIEAWLKGEKLLNQKVSRITPGSINQYINPEGDLALSSRKSRLAAISGFCEFCQIKRFMKDDPSRESFIKRRGLSVRQKEGVKRHPFTEKEYDRFMQFLDLFTLNPGDTRLNVENARFWQAATPFSYWAGLRLGDVCCLEWDSIQDGQLIVHTQKSESRLALPLNDPLIGSGELHNVLKDLEENDSRYVFPHFAAIQLDPASRSFLSKDFRRWAERAGLGVTNKTFHCLRHSFVTRLKRAGKTIEEIGTLVGHRDTSTTDGYSH